MQELFLGPQGLDDCVVIAWQSWLGHLRSIA